MTSIRERQQRAAARARLAREMAERQAAARKRRQRNLIVGAVAAALLVVAGTAWAVVAALGDDEVEPSAAATPPATPSPDPAASDECTWIPEDPSTNPAFNALTDVGTPPPGEPREGISTVTLETNLGVVEFEMDRSLVPCTAASFTHLAEQDFYDGSACHRLVDGNIHVLQCGDPTGTSQGGPTYRFAEENLPAGEDPPYPRGVVAMAKTQAPSSTGSQFFFVFEDTVLPAEYTVVGTVTEGMDIIDQVAAAGHNGEMDEGYPNEEIIIEDMRVSDPS